VDTQGFPSSQLIQVGSFVGFYLGVELLFWTRMPLSHLSFVELFVLLLISFLNFIPAGIFSFMVTSLIPQRLASVYNEANLRALPIQKVNGRIAVLYTTYNDFMPDHAEYDITEARKGGFPFYILDDSTDAKVVREIEHFAKANNCVVCRRSTRQGYKAGAINHWMTKHGQGYDYFFILDSDSRASADAIRRCADLASRDLDIAVVQSKTLTMTSMPTRLTRSAVTVQHAYMEIVQKAMKNLGTTPYYGHNALIKVSVLHSVGGFVEESNEDYKTLARFYQRGYRSLYAESIVTWEEVPPDYISSRKRSLRWSRDAVSQMSLIKCGGPEAVGFFLFYGWTTHMSNLALMLLLPTLTLVSVPHLFNNGMATIAGAMTLSVIVLWPALAVRIKDPELTLRKMGTSLFWGSAYNIPMMAPIALQILKTIESRTVTSFERLILGRAKTLKEEFVVTPKTRKAEHSLRSVASKLKVELAAGVGIIMVAVAAAHPISLLFAAPQVLSAIALPILVFLESGSRTPKKKLPRLGRMPYDPAHHAPLLNYERLPPPAVQKLKLMV
jgi:cellulose synthase/poly-beta-1,6-N-acetylglucosamine synthase-like glycosyltransferase